MKNLAQDLFLYARQWIPFLVVFGVSASVLAVARHFLVVQQKTKLGESGLGRQLFMLFLTGVALVGLTLVLPVGDAARGQLLSLLGLVISATIALSSTTFVGNAMAGLMLRAVRAFRPGDFLKVGDKFGRVTERGLLHTEIQTEDRDLTTLPNLYLVTNPVTVVRHSGTIISSTVSLGYDVPRGRIEQALVDAAGRAELEEPFVQILELGDFSVTYRVAGFLGEVKVLLTARSRLRAAMLDVLHERGIEIVSPTFMNQRQVAREQRFIPPREGRPAEAAVPGEAAEPEAIMFDKAEQAQTLEEIKELIAKVEAEREEVHASLPGTAGEEEREKLKRRVATLDRRKEILEKELARRLEAQKAPQAKA